MTRFQFSLRPLPARCAEPVLAQRALDASALTPQGPGWFESSWDLSHGLEVDESPPAESRFDAWLAARPDDFTRFGIDGLALA